MPEPVPIQRVRNYLKVVEGKPRAHLDDAIHSVDGGEYVEGGATLWRKDLHALLAMLSWRSGETAPTDRPIIAIFDHLGEDHPVVAWVARGGRNRGHWTASMSVGHTAHMAVGVKPSKWMDLPR